MYELVEDHAKRAFGTPREMFGMAACIALVCGLLALSIFGGREINQGSQPGDEELTANFCTHEATFAQLVAMLAADYSSVAAKKAAAIDLAAIAAPDPGSVRLQTYRRLLRQISVSGLRYFPDSGELVLVPDGQENLEHPSKSYVYLPHAQPQSFNEHHIYYWRGPGVYILTGDRRLEASWYIRHEMTVEVAVTPY